MKNSQIGIHFFYSFFKRVFLFSIIWIVLTDGDFSSLWIGIPIIFLSAFISLILNPPIFYSFTAFMKFVPFYIFHALWGGFDVMLRVFARTLDINPGLVEYHLRIPIGVQQDMIVTVLNLLPGTLSVNIENNILLIHVLDIEKNTQKEVALIEHYINDIFYIEANKEGFENGKI